MIMAPNNQSDQTIAFKKMEDDISNDLTPLCYICKTKLIIEQQEARDGTKRYHYSCENNANCGLEDGFVKLGGMGQLRQTMTKKVLYGLVGFVTGGFMMVVPGINQGLQTFVGNKPETASVADKNVELQEQIWKLKRDTADLRWKIQRIKLQLPDDEESGDLSFREKFNLALLYSGRKAELKSKDVENYQQAKTILFDLVDNYSGSREMGDDEAISIAISLAGLRHRAGIEDAKEIIERIEKLDLPVFEKYLRQAEIYYVMGYSYNNSFRAPSLKYYLKCASIESLPDQSRREFREQLEFMVSSHMLTPIWSDEEVLKLLSLVDQGKAHAINAYSNQLEAYLEHLES